MGAWSSLKEFFGRRELVFAPMHDPFIQIDRAAASEDLSLRERGREQGALNLPAAEMEALDNVEADIIGFIRETYSRAQIETANSIRTYDSRLNDLALLSKLAPIKATATTAVSDFKAEVVNRRNRLSNSADTIVSSYGELRQFREHHGLNRPAHTASSAAVTISMIALSWVFETALNSVLLKQNDSMGWLGGIMAAAAVGAINVGVAALVGRFAWPYTAHRSRAYRTFAWLGIAAWIVLLVNWNLLAAHYRDAKSLNLANPENQALHMMGAGLDSIYSWGLLIAGFVFAGIAALAGYRMDDPYPGYGAVTRRHNTRCEDYAAEVEAASEELLAIRNDAVDDAMSVRTELAQQLTERDQILTAREALGRRYEEYGAQLEQTANALLQEYRAANRSARTEPAPRHFNTDWVLPRVSIQPGPTPPVTQAAVDSAEAAVGRATAEITSAFDAAIASFEPLDVLKQRLANG